MVASQAALDQCVRQSLKLSGHSDSICERFSPHDFGHGVVHDFNLPGIQPPLHARPHSLNKSAPDCM
jgi:hypothetical protein